MILSIFLLIVGLSIALLIVGFAISDTALQLVGFSFLFLAGSLLLAGSVEYNTGSQVYSSFVYSDNYSGYHWDYSTSPPICNNPSDASCINLFHLNETTIYFYTPFNDTSSHFLGVYLMIVSILGSAVIFTRLKQENDF